MINCTAGGTGSSSGHPFDNEFICRLYVQGQIDFLILFCKSLFQRFRLWNGSGKSVQNVAVFTILLMDSFQEHGNGNVIRHELSLIHEALRLFPQLCLFFQIGSENISCGNMRQLIFRCDSTRLASFSGTGST